MKLVGALVLLFVLIPANGEIFLDDGPEDSTANWRLIPDDEHEDPDDGDEDHIDGAEDPNIYPVNLDEGDRTEELAFGLDKVYQTLNKMENGHSESELRGKGSKCKPNMACTILNGYCVVNTTLCSGRLVPDGCKGSNCQCCIPPGDNVNVNINLNETVNHCQVGENSTLWKKVNAAEADIKDIINEGNQNVTRNMEIKINGLEMKIKSMEENITQIIEDQGINHCPDGFFRLPAPSNQCLKLFNDTTRSWVAAKSKCQAEGLLMAKPYDAITLRQYIVERFGNHYIWLGAKGFGSNIKWDRDNVVIGSNNLLWWPGHATYKSTSYCMWLTSEEGHIKTYPGSPYAMGGCTWRIYTLCERLME